VALHSAKDWQAMRCRQRGMQGRAEPFKARARLRGLQPIRVASPIPPIAPLPERRQQQNPAPPRGVLFGAKTTWRLG